MRACPSMPPRVRRKCFVSYHGEDLAAVEQFIARFGKHNFIKRGITLPREVIASNDTEYVMRRIREIYLRDSTVSILLIGECTWARRYVDWELQASLRRPVGGHPNGLIGILLDPKTRPTSPSRFRLNRDSGYAKYHFYPRDVTSLEAGSRMPTRVGSRGAPRSRTLVSGIGSTAIVRDRAGDAGPPRLSESDTRGSAAHGRGSITGRLDRCPIHTMYLNRGGLDG
jgi:hypothetical protein